MSAPASPPPPPPMHAEPTAGHDRAALDRSLVRGVAWSGAARWGAQVLAWGSTIIVARLLSLADYGLVGLAATYLGLITLLSEFGIGATIVAMRELSDDQLAQMNSLSVMFGVLGFAISCAVAPGLAWFFDAPELTLVVIAMATIFLITGFRVAPQALMQRGLRFRDLAINHVVQAAVLSGGAILFAVLGFRYWTLVISAVLGAALSTAGVLLYIRLPFHWPDWRGLAPAIRFSGHMIQARLGWYVYQNADFLIAGKMLGKEALGTYRFAWDLASAPIEKLTSLVGGVTPSILSAAQKDLPALRRYLLRISEALSLATFPATIGLALVAEDVVLLALGAKWQPAIAPLQILAVSAAIRSIMPVMPQFLAVIGQTRHIMAINVAGAVVMPVMFWIGSHWGTRGIAAMWLLGYPLVLALPLARVVFRALGVTLGEYLRALAAPLSSVLIMAVAVLLARRAQPDSWPLLAGFAADVAVGAISYGASLFLLHRPRVTEVLRAIRRIRSGADSV